METPQASLGSRQPGYMTFYRQMWDLLQNRSVSKLLMGLHAIRDGGSVWLLKEWKTPLRCIDIDSESIQIDGYVVYMPGLPQPVVAISCEGWKHCFKGALYMNQIAALQNQYVSTSLWRAPTGIMELDKNDVLLAKEAAIARVIGQYPT